MKKKIFLKNSIFFKELFCDINCASKEIIIELYKYNEDLIGEKMLNCLINASKRGVKIKILLDGIGSYSIKKSFLKKIIDNKIFIKIFHPVPWQINKLCFGNIKYLSFFKAFFSLIKKINRRNHNKLYIIDKKIFYLGSINISLDHLEYQYGGKNWQDIGIKVINKYLSLILLKKFYSLWNDNYYNIYRIINNKYFIFDNIYKKFYFYDNIIKNIISAKKNIWISSAYFVPNKYLIKVLKKKSYDLDVSIIISKKSDVKIISYINYYLSEVLRDSKINVYEYDKYIIHSKIILIDNICIIGSSNMNHRSFFCDFETNIIIRSMKFHKNIKKYFLEKFYHSNLMIFNIKNKIFCFKRFIGFIIFKYFKKWI